MNKPRILIIVGKSGVGKTTIAHQLKNVNHIVLNTTRPMRPNECQGESYYFCSVEDFNFQKETGHLISYQKFNDWIYYLDDRNIDEEKINVLVANPQMALEVIRTNKYSCLCIELRAKDIERLQRCLNRADSPREVCRRFLADEDDFNNFYLHCITEFGEKPKMLINTNGELNHIIDTLQLFVNSWSES